MGIEFERGVELTGDLIESFCDALAGNARGVGGNGDFPIEGPTGREEEVYQMVRERIQKRHPWIVLTLKVDGKINCSGINP